MKKGWKIFWIICGVFAAVGIALTVAGTALGGLALLRDERDEHIIRNFLDRIGIHQSVTMTTEVEALPDDLEDLLDEGYEPGEPDGMEIFSFAGIDELDLELTGMAVYVNPYEEELEAVYDGEIIVDTSGCREDLKDKISVSQDGSELKIEMEDRGRLATENSGAMFISVPRGMYFEKISADAVAGLIELSEIQAGELSVETDAGQIIASAFSVEKLNAECGVGNITLEGDVTDTAEISCNIGTVICTLPGEMEAYDYEVKCDAGEILIDGESYSGIHNKMKIDNGSGCRIEADCNMGSIEILFE